MNIEKFVAGLHDYISRALRPLADRISDLEKRTLEKGEPGKDGKNGEPGKDGTSVTIEDVYPLINDLVAKAVEKIPPPKDGQDGANGRDGIDGAPGVDGKSVTLEEIKTNLLDPALSTWQLDFERRAQDTLQRSIDRIPAPKNGENGKDGADGFGFDDLSITHDEPGTIVLRFERGAQVKEFTLRIPVFIDRGVFVEDQKYTQGNGVTFGGSFWLAQVDDPQGKPGLSKDWRLAVKKGRDGRDAKVA